MQPLHNRFHLYTEGDDTYIFTPVDDGVETQYLSIHRASGDITLSRPNAPIPNNARRSLRSVYGIVGLISLSLSEYIIVLTGRELQGRLMGHEIYRATEFDILPMNPNVSVSYPPHPAEAHLLALVRSHLQNGNFLFAYGWDLTRRLQAQWQTQAKASQRHFWQMADDRFFWNRFLQSRFIDATAPNAKQDIGRFILPIMYGTFDIRATLVRGRHLQLCVISRRSRFRAGTRYFRRGIDHDGHVANFNETEQLVLVENPGAPGLDGMGYDSMTKMSFVQIRGSIPLYWAEVNTLRYKPDLQVMDLPDTAPAMKKHLTELVSIYGPQCLVSLVNHKGHEKPVKEAYERYIEEASPLAVIPLFTYAYLDDQLNLPDVRYGYFDFHTECKHMRWERISLLIDKMKEDLEKQKWFQLDADGSTPSVQQAGTVRTNCMDNLDRTNVVQATLAKHTLTLQLRALGILPPDAGVDDYSGLSQDFRELWADHGDAISNAYAGSAALKSDFTRTNKRTPKGAFDDGVKSVVRYLKNNYFDGPRQDAYDLVTGAWVPKKNPAASLFLVTDARPIITRAVPVVAYFSLFMVLAGLTLPRTSDYSLVYYFLLWFNLLSAALAYIFIHGIDYVSWPRLVPPTDTIYYNGPGFRSGQHGKGLKGPLGYSGVKERVRWLGRGNLTKNHVDEIELGDLKKRVD